MSGDHKSVLVCGAGGFIGGHLVKRLEGEGFWVRGVDLKFHEYAETAADDFVIGDLRDQAFVPSRRSTAGSTRSTSSPPTWAAPATSSPASTTPTSCTIRRRSTSTCSTPAASATSSGSSTRRRPASIPAYNQEDPRQSRTAPRTRAYPAAPDSEYGWEKLFSERLYLAYTRNYGMQVRIARFHNIFGPEGTWNGGQAKRRRPRSAARSPRRASGDAIEIWGDGEQTRSFLYIDECLEGVSRLIALAISTGPVNIGSDEMVTHQPAGRHGRRHRRQAHRQAPHSGADRRARAQFRQSRSSSSSSAGRRPQPLRDGVAKTYAWILAQTQRNVSARHLKSRMSGRTSCGQFRLAVNCGAPVNSMEPSSMSSFRPWSSKGPRRRWVRF